MRLDFEILFLPPLTAHSRALFPTLVWILVQLEQFDSILFNDEWADLVTDLNLGKIREPSIRSNKGIVGSKEHLRPQSRVNVLNQGL
jgi:hypothetical protein